jgi:branched-chain amino acid transport system permease protein
MEAATTAIQRTPIQRRAIERARVWIDRWGLIVVLLALPVTCAIGDLTDAEKFVFVNFNGPGEDDLSRLAGNLKDGLSNGAIWALIALGYTLVYGIIQLINFAHGDLFTIGSFTAVALYGTFGLATGNPVLGLIAGLLGVLVITMITCGVLNAMIERVGYRPLRHAPKLAPLITAVGFSFILQNVAILWLGPAQQAAPDLIQSQKELFEIAGVSVTQGDVLAVVATIPLLLLLGWFVTTSRMGKAMRATSQDPEAARLMGINVDTTISLTFVLGGLMAGAAGLIYALYQTTIWYFAGFNAGLIAFTAAVMGGIGSLQGAVLGGVIIGCIQQLSDNRIGGEWTPAIVFAYLVLIMVFKPQGLLGEQTREAG